jgi:flagellar protein FlaG
MTLQIGRFTPYEHLAAAKYASSVPSPSSEPARVVQQQPAQPKTGVQESGTILGDVPPAPTPEARELVAKAAEVVQEMHDNNRELHFSKDETTNRVIIEVRDLDGKVLKTIPPKSALAFLTGDSDQL